MKEAASAPPCEIGPVGPVAGGSRPAPQPTGEADTRGDRRHVAGCSVDLVRCSTAVRARASAKPVVDALGCAVRYERALYTAGGREALESVGALRNDVDTVMLIGHNPSAGGVDGNVVRVVTPVSDGRARHDHDRSLGARRAGIRHAYRARHPRAAAGRR